MKDPYAQLQYSVKEIEQLLLLVPGPSEVGRQASILRSILPVLH